jgi:hypothetical protein
MCENLKEDHSMIKEKGMQTGSLGKIVIAGKGENGEIFYFAWTHGLWAHVVDLDDREVSLRSVSPSHSAALSFASEMAGGDPEKFLSAFRKYAPGWNWDFFEP